MNDCLLECSNRLLAMWWRCAKSWQEIFEQLCFHSCFVSHTFNLLNEKFDNLNSLNSSNVGFLVKYKAYIYLLVLWFHNSRKDFTTGKDITAVKKGHWGLIDKKHFCISDISNICLLFVCMTRQANQEMFAVTSMGTDKTLGHCFTLTPTVFPAKLLRFTVPHTSVPQADTNCTLSIKYTYCEIL